MAAKDAGKPPPTERPAEQAKPRSRTRKKGEKSRPHPDVKTPTDQHLHELWQVLGLDDEDE